MKQDPILESVSKSLKLTTRPELAEKFYVTISITKGTTEGKANLELELGFYK